MRISIIIPVRNGGADLSICLAAVERTRVRCSALAETELIVVDDGSTDDSVTRAQAVGARMSVSAAPSEKPAGPAAARNRGARLATGDFLFFVDADVALHPAALSLAAQALQADPQLEAVFGSYDTAPAQANFLSQYKNLLHHYVHQHAQTQAATFWTGCGAMRATTYRALGGLDEQTYPRPSIEDIDLGYRLRRRGGKIHLLKAMHCTHLKRWTVASLLRSDIFERGLPWTRLLWRENVAQRGTSVDNRPPLLDLNLQIAGRVSVVAAGLGVGALAGAVSAPPLGLVALVCATVLLALNRDLYLFFFRQRGFWFTLGAVFWHWLYFLYSGLSFALGTLQYWLQGASAVNPDGSLPRAFPNQ